MKIAFVISGLSDGGAERFASNITNYLSENTLNEIHLITGRKVVGEYKLSNKTKRHEFLTINPIIDTINIRNFMKQYDIDVCVGIDIYPNIIVSLSNLKLQTKIVVSERTAPGYMSYSKFIKMIWSVARLLPDYFVFQTNDAREYYGKSVFKKSSVIPNPIPKGLPRRSERNHKEIISIGRLNKVKNYEMLINAFCKIHKDHPDYILRIFGEGPEKDNLVNLVQSTGDLDHVVFEGFSDDVHSNIVHGDIYVLTSNLEGMPNSLLEAMAMGFPVISTDCPSGGPRELIGCNENGLLVPVGNEDELYMAMKKLIVNRELNKLLSERALLKSREYLIDHISGMWLELFDKLVNKEIQSKK